jgi:hypothetical protein
MLLPHLVRVVQSHADALVDELIASLRDDPHVPYLHSVGDDELRRRVLEVYENCAQWAAAAPRLGRREQLEEGYGALGRIRRAENVPASQLVYALVRAKEHLLDFVKRNAAAESSVEVYQESELEGMIHAFFDRAIYYALKGYEEAGVVMGELRR